MDIAQTTFYVLGSVFMIVGIGILIMVAIALWKIKETAEVARETIIDVRENVINKAASIVSDRKAEIAGAVGAGLTSFVLNRIKNIFKK